MDQQGLDLGDSAPARLPMVGVSTVAKAVVGAGGLLGWAWQQGRGGRPLHNQEALDRGNTAHRVLGLLLAGHSPYPQEYEPSWRPFMDGIVDWHRRTGARLLAVEVPMADQDRRVNGRIDYIRECPGCPACHADTWLPSEAHLSLTRGVILGDVKTGGLKIRRESHIQVGGGYMHLWQSTHVAARPVRAVCCGAEILAVDATGESRAVGAKATAGMFLRALDWYRDLTTIPDEFA